MHGQRVWFGGVACAFSKGMTWARSLGRGLGAWRASWGRGASLGAWLGAVWGRGLWAWLSARLGGLACFCRAVQKSVANRPLGLEVIKLYYYS